MFLNTAQPCVPIDGAIVNLQRSSGAVSIIENAQQKACEVSDQSETSRNAFSMVIYMCFRLFRLLGPGKFKILKGYRPSRKTPVRPQIQRLWALPLQNFSPALAAKALKLRRGFPCNPLLLTCGCIICIRLCFTDYMFGLIHSRRSSTIAWLFSYLCVCVAIHTYRLRAF